MPVHDPQHPAHKELQPTGRTGPQPPESAEDESNPRICYCMKVHREELVAAIQDGARTVEELREQTAAGTGCGTCRSELLALLKELLPGESVDSRIW